MNQVTIGGTTLNYAKRLSSVAATKDGRIIGTEIKGLDKTALSIVVRGFYDAGTLDEFINSIKDTDARDTVIKFIVDTANEIGNVSMFRFVKENILSEAPGAAIREYLEKNTASAERFTEKIVDGWGNQGMETRLLKDLLSSDKSQTFTRALTDLYQHNRQRDHITRFAQNNPELLDPVLFSGGKDALIMADRSGGGVDGTAPNGTIDAADLANMNSNQLLQTYILVSTGKMTITSANDELVTSKNVMGYLTRALDAEKQAGRNAAIGGSAMTALISGTTGAAVGISVLSGGLALPVSLLIGLGGNFASMVIGAESSRAGDRHQQQLAMNPFANIKTEADLQAMAQFVKDGGLALFDQASMDKLMQYLYDNINDGSPNAEKIAATFCEAVNTWLESKSESKNATEAEKEKETKEQTRNTISTSLENIIGINLNGIYGTNGVSAIDVDNIPNEKIKSIVGIMRDPKSVSGQFQQPASPERKTGTASYSIDVSGIRRSSSSAVREARQQSATGNQSADIITAGEFAKFSDNDISIFITDVYNSSGRDGEKTLNTILGYANNLGQEQGARLRQALMKKYDGGSAESKALSAAINRHLAMADGTGITSLLGSPPDKASIDKIVKNCLKPDTRNYACLQNLLKNGDPAMQDLIISRLIDGYHKADSLSKKDVSDFLKSCGESGKFTKAFLDKLDLIPTSRYKEALPNPPASNIATGPGAASPYSAQITNSINKDGWVTELHKVGTITWQPDTLSATDKTARLETLSIFLAHSDFTLEEGKRFAQDMVNAIDNADNTGNMRVVFERLVGHGVNPSAVATIFSSDFGYIRLDNPYSSITKGIDDPGSNKEDGSTRSNSERLWLMLGGIATHEINQLHKEIKGGAAPGSDRATVNRIRTAVAGHDFGNGTFPESLTAADLKSDFYLGYIVMAGSATPPATATTADGVTKITYDDVTIEVFTGLTSSNNSFDEILAKLAKLLK